MLIGKVSIAALASWMLALTLAMETQAELACLNEDGEPVDWFIAYKFPIMSGDNLFNEGQAYAYITSEDVDQGAEGMSNSKSDTDTQIFLHQFKDLLLKYLGFREPNVKAPKTSLSRSKSKKTRRRKLAKPAKWVASHNSVSSSESIIMRTLAPVYDESGARISSVFYNDDPTETEGESDGDDESGTESEGKRNKISQSNRRAHAKGVLLMDEISGDGVWLSHSVPRFPTIRNVSLKFPESGMKNGQTFMCITFELDKSGRQIVDHLVNMRPLVYDHKISKKMFATFPALNDLDLLPRKRRKGALKNPPKLGQHITTKDGQVLQIFSKAVAFDADIYAGWMDKEIGSGLYVETWRNGAGSALNSSCPKDDYHVNNVEDLKYDTGLTWSYSKDHSKWAISEEEGVGIVCIADSNRVASQFKRGGGAVCIKCPECWNVFSNTIQDVEPCPVNKGRLVKSQPVSRSALEKIETFKLGE